MPTGDITNWAYRVLFKLSPVSVPDEEVEILSKQRAPLPSLFRRRYWGTGTSAAEWPWMVSVFEDGTFICNGTVIAPKAVLSAANCMSGERRGKFEVATMTDNGPNVRNWPADSGYQFLSFIPTFSEDTALDDIVILEIGTALPPPFITIATQKSADPRIGELTLARRVRLQIATGKPSAESGPNRQRRICAAMYPARSRPSDLCAGFEHGGAVAWCTVVPEDSAVLLQQRGPEISSRDRQFGRGLQQPQGGPRCLHSRVVLGRLDPKAAPNLPGEQGDRVKR